MTAPTLLLVSWLACLPGVAGQPKPPAPPATEFDGEWREPAPAAGGLRATFNFAAENVTIDLYGQTMRGSFRTEPHWPLSVIVLDVNTREGKRFRVTGVCRRHADSLYLRLAPEDADAPPGGRAGVTGTLGLAPLILSLERVGK